MATLKAVKGMNDLLPAEISIWQKLESSFSKLMLRYGYNEIRLPILERTEVFTRAIGEVTDIVEKEMYTFEDLKGRKLSMRPEGTAQCVRAALEHSLLYGHTPRLWYYGPMFRYEAPQMYRYRQFYQLGVETFGIETPDIDAEQIIMMHQLWQELGLLNDVKLKLNSLGTPACRAAYREALVAYFEQHVEKLDEDSQRRLKSNPLRILDTKNPAMTEVVAGAPKLPDYLSDEAKKHFETLRQYLDNAGVEYEIDTKLVRGLDYYTLTVYEWVSDLLGAQSSVCGGGRYDGLVKMMGGKPTPAVGFAMGIERLVGMLHKKGNLEAPTLDAYLVLTDEVGQTQGLKVAQSLRVQYPHLKLLTHCGEGSAKSQLKKADKSGARVALLLGEQEFSQRQLTVKFLRENKEQQVVSLDDLGQYFAEDQTRSSCGSF